ncbi:hypothetical protein BMR1_03g02870 [Babesia microti strain RI]|uniref:Uncharacterized protein n=1 Tax=Babesia microti (strain RI) TaxID=1133968 RepID=A0A0K3AN72_BABMR|nr:hypothetical protein BMR1_03g02870 [Babesia microti strain RI]CTQ41174.1 hypothetical protein BMR1_03g02870 [Babesia microti strain RI]|eukprot:XP_012649185.1 hypothetical protein BMR1_03g02870 [Babesia microti strain RI]
MSNDELLPNINCIDKHGVLSYSVPDDLLISMIKWSSLFNVTLCGGYVFTDFTIRPLGDNKLDISLKCKNVIEENIESIIKSYKIIFPRDYSFPQWIKNTHSRVDQLITFKTVNINLSNDRFMDHFNVIPYMYFLGIDISINDPGKILSNVFWTIPSDCFIRHYFTRRIALTPHGDYTIKVFAQYFDEDEIRHVCSFRVPTRISVVEWFKRIVFLYSRTNSNLNIHNIDIDLGTDDFLEKFEIIPFNNELHIFFRNDALHNQLIGSVRWGNLFSKIFQRNDVISSIDLIPLGDNRIKIHFVHLRGTNRKSKGHTIQLPPDYEFPKWLAEDNKSFLKRVQSEVLFFDMSNDVLPKQFGVIHGFNTIELFIKQEFYDKTALHIVRWGNQMFFNLNIENIISKIILTASGDNRMDVGVLYMENKKSDQISRKLSTVIVDESKIPTWLKERIEFTEALLKSETKLYIDLSNDELNEELEIKLLNPSEVAITVSLAFMDCCTIKSVSWTDQLLFGCNDKYTIVKIIVEMVNCFYNVKIIYYNDANKIMQHERYFEDKNIPKWFLDLISQEQPLITD